VDQLNHVVLENGAESIFTEVFRKTCRYIYVHVSQFNSCAGDLEKSVNFIHLESGSPGSNERMVTVFHFDKVPQKSFSKTLWDWRLRKNMLVNDTGLIINNQNEYFPNFLNHPLH